MQAKKKRVTLAQIEHAVAGFYQLDVAALYALPENDKVAFAMQVLFAIARDFGRMRIDDIAAHYRGCTKNTVLQALYRFYKNIENDKETKRNYMVIAYKLGLCDIESLQRTTRR